MTARGRLFSVLVVFLVLYLVSYLVLSRRGYALVDHDGYQMNYFYFFEPRDTVAWRVGHFGGALLFAPLIALDVLAGTGRSIGGTPQWSLNGVGGAPDELGWYLAIAAVLVLGGCLLVVRWIVRAPAESGDDASRRNGNTG